MRKSEGILRTIGLVFFVAILAASAFGQDLEPQPKSDLRVSYLPQLTFWGGGAVAKIDAFRLFPAVKSTIWLNAYGAYKTGVYYHDPVTEEALKSTLVEPALFKYTTANWFVGFVQGLVPQPSERDGAGRRWEASDLVSSFSFYRGNWLNTFNLGNHLNASTLPDRLGYVGTSFSTGLYYDAVTLTDSHGLKQGFYAEISAEGAPRALQSVAVDFARWSANVRAFVPVFDLEPAKPENVFSVLFGFYAAVDQLSGQRIPFSVLQTMGGFWTGSSIGGTVRGIDYGRFDATFKAVANAEFRIQLPGVYWKDLGPLYPGVVAYFDAGAWNGLKGIDPGFVSSTGVGLFLNVFDSAQLIVYNDYWLNGTPYDGSTFVWHASLGLHF